MKIVLINQFFWPDTAPTSQLLTDLARHLAMQGFSVTVLCGRGSYTQAHPDRGVEDPPNVRVWRCPSLPFGRHPLVRLLSYVSFLISTVCCGALVGRSDLILTLTTPPLLGLVGTVLKGLTGARHFSWEMDLYPEIGLDLGVFDSRSRLLQALRTAADLIHRRAEGVLVPGYCMRQRLMDRGVDPEKIHVTENWADGNLVYPIPKRTGSRFTILYSGNLGLAHDVETISAAMVDLRENSRFEFVFVGGGPKRAAFEEFCSSRRLPNVRFLPYRPSADLALNYSTGDVALVTQLKDCYGSVVPSKVYAYMAAEKPLIYVGPLHTTPAHIIERYGCGWHVDCGDSAGLVRLLVQLEQDRERVRKAGQNARATFLEYYDRPLGVARISAALSLPVPPISGGAIIDHEAPRERRFVAVKK